MRKKIFFLITVLTILVMFTSISQASETNTKDEILSYDYAPVIGDFVPDPELEKPCPWYISHGDDRSQFPVATNLHKWTGYYYVPIPYGRAGANPIDTNLVESSVIYTINKKYGVLAAGNSTGKKDYTLPGYPTDENINHWIAIDGYDNNGKTIWIVDPAKSDVIRWSKNIKKYYDIPSTLLRNYVSTRGLIW